MTTTAVEATQQGKVRIQNILQIGLVVEDLYETMRHYWEVLGIGPWNIYIIRPPELTDAAVHGIPQSYSFKAAIAQVGNIQWELIQPLSENNIYREFLDQKGGGLHHVLVAVENFDDTMQQLNKGGMGVLMQGTWRGFTWSYADTEKRLGAIFEFFKTQPDWAMSGPDEIYPPQAE
ncbi:MAG: VOC family protein [Terriglobales bacterium]